MFPLWGFFMPPSPPPLAFDLCQPQLFWSHKLLCICFIHAYVSIPFSSFLAMHFQRLQKPSPSSLCLCHLVSNCVFASNLPFWIQVYYAKACALQITVFQLTSLHLWVLKQRGLILIMTCWLRKKPDIKKHVSTAWSHLGEMLKPGEIKLREQKAEQLMSVVCVD